MEHDKTIIGAWHTAKGVGICFVVSLAAGWLSRELLFGNIDPANKAAAYILDLTVLVVLLVLTVLGAKRWKANQLTPAAKRLLIISVVLLVVFFIVGWNYNPSVK
jgi:uncharacterized membrane protein YtjA (UPF0391 family)